MNQLTNSIQSYIPSQDEAAWGDLTYEAKHRVELLFEVANAIKSAPFGTKGDLYKQYAKELGYKHVNGLSGPIGKFLKDGNWWHLVDRRRDSKTWIKTKSANLPHAFVEFCKSLIESNHRNMSVAYDQLMEQLKLWRKGDMHAAIPGYTTPPPNAPGCNHPASWSYKTFLRNAPSRIELEAARHGRTAAMKHAPNVYTTRKGGYPGMELQFDDQHHNIETIFGDNLCRPLEFGGIDFFTNFILPPGIKPRTVDVKTGKHRELTELEHALFVINTFCTTGYNQRGTLCVAENAKAVIRDGLGSKLTRWSNGAIKTYTPAMSGRPIISGGYSERASGASNAKALKEGSHSLYQAVLASIPGQLGMNRDDAPAYLHGMRKETKDLLLAQGRLTEKLATSHMRFEDYVFLVHSRILHINQRTEHNIEGWLEEGLTTIEYLADALNDRWINIAEQPKEQQVALQIIAQYSPHNFRPRKLSPYEVWTPAAKDFIRLSPIAEADCLYEYARREEAVKAGYFDFQDKDMGIGRFRYRSQYQDRYGMIQYLPNDVSFNLVINPFNPERAFIFSLKGEYLGLTPRHHAAMRSDAEAVHREQGKKAAHAAALLNSHIVRNGLKKNASLTHNAHILELAMEARLNPQTHQPIHHSDQPSIYDDCDLPTAPEHPSDDIDVSQLLL